MRGMGTRCPPGLLGARQRTGRSLRAPSARATPSGRGWGVATPLPAGHRPPWPLAPRLSPPRGRLPPRPRKAGMLLGRFTKVGILKLLLICLFLPQVAMKFRMVNGGNCKEHSDCLSECCTFNHKMEKLCVRRTIFLQCLDWKKPNGNPCRSHSECTSNCCVTNGPRPETFCTPRTIFMQCRRWRKVEGSICRDHEECKTRCCLRRYEDVAHCVPRIGILSKCLLLTQIKMETEEYTVPRNIQEKLPERMKILPKEQPEPLLTSQPKTSLTTQAVTSLTTQPVTSPTIQSMTSLTTPPVTSPIIQSTVSDITQPTVSDITQPTVSDITQSTVGDITQPTVSDITQPTVSDITQPTVSDITQPIVSDITQPIVNVFTNS
ncbi:leucine-rich colipase-like protein 1 isoform X1 [Macrotis lagotis]|uniref:leucine-rich colipase-like protein 1 isoform X1 n=1 Tax=Macrotis lagotis TaxID=92651 RepID=UPI003D691FA9